jgi:CheY-like chemotaxis protein
VIDTGIGIPAEKQKGIFESFQQADGSTSRKFGGTGLGLTISREFAKLLGGEILLQSKEGDGSTFTFCLPLEPPGNAETVGQGSCFVSSEVEAEASVITSCPTPGRVLSNDATTTAPTPVPKFIEDDRANLQSGEKTILIVEDDKRFAHVLMDLCRKKEFKCLVVNSGGVALQLAAEYKLSGILLDLGLPDMDGMIVLDELKHNMATRHIPVHIVSGREKSMEALTKGALGFLTKPVTSADVMLALEKVEELLSTTTRRLLVIENDPSMRRFIAKTVPFEGVELTESASAMEGYNELQKGTFDCLILDFELAGTNGLELLQKLEQDSIPVPPVVVYSSQDFSQAERQGLESLGCIIVAKNASSPELLADKVSLFLHCVESSLPEKQRQKIRMLHDPSDGIRGKKILLVDDDMRNLFALSKTLEKAGMVVVLAENGQHALNTLNEEHDIDLVLMDIMMPVMDGYEAMQRIRSDERTAMLPVIALTANAMPEDRAKCLDAGANDYLTKPVDADRLLSLIRVWIYNQSVVCK